jgi:hypothetical protein
MKPFLVAALVLSLALPASAMTETQAKAAAFAKWGIAARVRVVSVPVAASTGRVIWHKTYEVGFQTLFGGIFIAGAGASWQAAVDATVKGKPP